MTSPLHDLTQPLTQLLSWAPLMRAALPLAALGWVVFALTRWLGRLTERIRQGSGPWRGAALRALPWARVGVVVAGLWAASRVLTATGAWLPVAALVGVALIGFAAGGFTLMRDAVMGLALSIQRPFRVGDHIEVDTPSGRCAGEVRSVGLRAVLLVSGDGNKTYIPNSQLLSQTITNKTPQAHVFPVTIRLTPPPTLPLDAARRLALHCAWASRFSSPHRAPTVTLAPDAASPLTPSPLTPCLLVHGFTYAPALEGALRTDVTELFHEGAHPLASPASPALAPHALPTLPTLPPPKRPS